MPQNVRLSLIPLICSLIVNFFAILVMIGWIQHNVYLVQILPHLVPMQFNTALCFLLIGIGIWAYVMGLKKLTVALSVLSIIIPILTLAEYFGDVNLWIDELFIRHDITVRTSHPGRMSPNTSLLFIISGIGLFFLSSTDKNHRYYTAATFATIVLLFSIDQLIQYLFSLEAFKAWNAFTQMALHTSFLFFLIGSAILTLSMTFSRTGSLSKWVYVAFGLTLYGISTNVWDLLFLSKSYSSVPVFVLFVLLYLGILVVTTLVFFHLFASINSTEKDNLYLVASKEYKARLISHMSNELSGPLSTLVGYTDLLKTETDGNKMKEMVPLLDGVIHHLQEITADLQGYSQLETGSLQVYESPVVLKAWITRISSIFGSMAQQAGKNLAITTSEGLPETVVTDEGKLTQIVYNYLDNALKYSNEKSQITLEIAFHAPAGKLSICVTNTGVGITEAQQTDLFLPLTQWEDNPGKIETGIGLTISSGYAQSLGGVVSVESVPHQKTSFRVILPVRLP